MGCLNFGRGTAAGSAQFFDMDHSPGISGHDFVISPLSADFVARVRSTRRDDFGREVKIASAQGGEPMRDQLRRAHAGERLILCSYQAVALPSDFAEIGPVYISAELEPAESAVGRLPEGYFNRLFALRSYDEQNRIVGSLLVEPASAPAAFATALASPGVAYLHARFAGHGCFAARVDRADSRSR